MGFSRQEYWNGLPCLPPGDLLDPGIEPVSPASPALQADYLPLSHWVDSKYIDCKNNLRHGVLEDNWCLWIWNATTIHWLEWGNYQVINAVLAGSYFVKHVMVTSPESTQVLFEIHKWTLAVEMGAVWDINLVDLVSFLNCLFPLSWSMTYLTMLIFLSNAILWWNVQQTAWYSVSQRLTRGWMIQFERGSELALLGVMRDRRLEDLDKFSPPSSCMGGSSMWSLHVNLTEKSCLPSKHSFWASSWRSQGVLKSRD